MGLWETIVGVLVSFFGRWENIASFVSVVSTVISICQFVVLRERKKQDAKMQHLLAGIRNSALRKCMAWSNQIQNQLETKNENDVEKLGFMMRARDDFAEIVSVVQALEGAVDPDGSAMMRLLGQDRATVQVTNQIREEGLRKSASV